MKTRDTIHRVERRQSAAGFSIIELLVVMSIVAILASIAIPRFTSATENSQNASVKSDVRNALSAQEVYFVETGSYADFDIEAGGQNESPSIHASPGVALTATTDGSEVKIVGTHQATSTTWCMSSSSGSLVQGEDC